MATVCVWCTSQHWAPSLTSPTFPPKIFRVGQSSLYRRKSGTDTSVTLCIAPCKAVDSITLWPGPELITALVVGGHGAVGSGPSWPTGWRSRKRDKNTTPNGPHFVLRAKGVLHFPAKDLRNKSVRWVQSPVMWRDISGLSTAITSIDKYTLC